VHLDDDVAIRVGLEVSNISNEITSGGGTVAYQVGTRNAATVLRLHDGETQMLAGLISDEDRRSATQVPGLAQLPLLGRLFRASNDTVNKTEIVLLITPRVVRNVDRPGADIEHFNSGSELDVGSAAGAAFAPVPPDSAPPPQAPPAPQPQAPPPPPAGATPPPSAPSSILPPPRRQGQQ
jgi:general secretion pathway protein D